MSHRISGRPISGSGRGRTAGIRRRGAGVARRLSFPIRHGWAAWALALLLAASAAGQASGRSPHRPKVDKVSLLYVVSASAGTLTPESGHPGRFTLTLRRLEREAVWFSDRPARRSG